jgi:hypothetical protein
VVEEMKYSALQKPKSSEGAQQRQRCSPRRPFDGKWWIDFGTATKPFQKRSSGKNNPSSLIAVEIRLSEPICKE